MPHSNNALDHLAEASASLGGRPGGDYLRTWDRSEAELRAVLAAASALRARRAAGLSSRVFDSGLAVSIFRDHSTRTRFSYASAANLLGLAVQELDEEKSQVAHGETVRETANMISFLTEAVGIRDDMYLGAGHTYMKEVADALDGGLDDGVLPQRPALINLQCDEDHPTQSLADLSHLAERFGGVDALRGKKIAMTWAYSPSYGKPLSVPQGIIGLMTRFGMEVSLAYPEGYNLIPDIEEVAGRQAAASGGTLSLTHDMDEAFDGADIVYPKSWAPFAVMGRRTELLRAGDREGLKALERECLAENERHVGWACTEARMARTGRNGRTEGEALYMHCLPADITGVSCERGEVDASVFERHRVATYLEASHKPYVIAAMMLLGRFDDPAGTLRALPG